MDEKKKVVFGYALNQMVIASALLVILVLVSEFFLNLNPIQRIFIRFVDLGIILVFAVDIFWHAYNSKNRMMYFRTHWLEVMAIIPVFEIAKLGRLGEFAGVAEIREAAKAGRLLKLAKAEEEVRSFEKAYKLVRGGIHEKGALRTISLRKPKY